MALPDPSTTRDAGIPQPVVDEGVYPRDTGSGRLDIGDRVGRYVITRKLGRGGMGVVYGARDTALGRNVALKLVRRPRRPSSHDASLSPRLIREAQALARLSHPNVVGLYDLGTATSAMFLAMEFIDGIDLHRHLTEQERSWHEIVSLFVQAGRGLSAAHAAGIVHRDFKPTNVIVGRDGHVTVVDFGLARSTDESEEPHPEDAFRKRLTDANVIIGTRGYMAPEQLLGLPVGPAADQFAFCVSLFEALYGERPYPGRNAVETARAFASRTLRIPADDRGVPLWIHAAIVRGLSVEPTERYPSMDALLAALDPVRPRAKSRLGRYGLAAALLLTAAASAVATAWVGARLSPAPPIATAAVSCDDPGDDPAP